MKLSHAFLALATGLLASTAYAQAPATAPAGSTGLCKDGTYTSNATKAGACTGHKGVKTWYVAAPAKTKAATPATTAPAPVPTTKTAPATVPATATPAPVKTAKPAASTTAAAPGGGAGLVWVNTDSKVYHCFGTSYYGKTKKGEYMTEAAAKTAGNHADHGKACGA